MDVYQVLKNDHREVEKMFEQLAGGSPEQDREALFTKLKEALIAHS